jgi:hypothetical protein
MNHHENREIIRLASIVETFNAAAETRMGNDAAIQQQLRTAMTPADEQALAEQAEILFDTAMEIMIKGEDEDAKARIGACTIAFVDTLLGLIRKAGLEDTFAADFPAHEKTQANAESFREQGAPNIARLCLK